MGTWTLEVARMGVYMFFPVALFYVFNQPQWFEEYIVKNKKELFSSVNLENSKVCDPILQDCNQATGNQ